MDVMGGGCEPYDLDFGDREYAAWLEANLTADELAERAAAWQQMAGALKHLWWLPYRVAELLTWRRRRRVARWNDVARERGGDPPGPSWKVRHEFGAAA